MLNLDTEIAVRRKKATPAETTTLALKKFHPAVHV
jgi:hypothetical protein